jgi:hypothetical protein
MVDIKQHLAQVGQDWIRAQIDVAVENNPRLSFISKRLKDGLCKVIANKIDTIDPYLPYITDENGMLNIRSMSEELLNAFDEMPVRVYNTMGLDMQIGRGRVEIFFPDNIITNIFLDNNKLVISREDILELVKTLN